MHIQLVLEAGPSLKCVSTRKFQSQLFLGRHRHAFKKQKEKEAKVKQCSGKGMEINKERGKNSNELSQNHMPSGTPGAYLGHNAGSGPLLWFLLFFPTHSAQYTNIE